MNARRVALLGFLALGCWSAAATAAPPAPRKVFAVANGFSTQGGEVPNNPSDSLMFYDVTNIGQPGAAGVFNNSPLFSVWMGYEVFDGQVLDLPTNPPRGQREEISAVTFNPANGTVYVGSYDSGAPGAERTIADTQGDFDLYRIDYQKILADYVMHSRPRGTIYGPSTQLITQANEEFLESIDSDIFDGTVDGVAHDVPHPTALTSTVFVEGAFEKIGEVGRAVQVSDFFDLQLDFIDPANFVYLDQATTTGPVGGNPLGDHQIRAIQRISTTPGLATLQPLGPDGATGPIENPATFDNNQGGNNRNTTESWKSTIIGRPMMDADSTDIGGWAFVKRDGKMGVWVADNELSNTGDQVSYFELDFSGATPTATKKPLPSATPGSLAFRVDEDPTTSATTNDGEIDFLQIDKNGNLVIGESGFFDTSAGSMTPPLGFDGLTARQPRVMTVGIESYNNAAGVTPVGNAASGGTVTFDSPPPAPGPWTVSGSVPEPANDDDNGVINTTKVGYDRSTGYIYILELDDGTAGGFMEDIYVFDPATGSLVYHEINGLNPSLFNAGTQIIFTRGDINGDSLVNLADVQRLRSAIADPTLGQTVTAALGGEWYDLTGDNLLTAADMTEMMTNILRTRPGDFNIDGMVNADDLVLFKAGYGTTFTGADFVDWQRNLGFNSMAATPVPEPAAVALAALGCLAVVASGRRRTLA